MNSHPPEIDLPHGLRELLHGYTWDLQTFGRSVAVVFRLVA